MATDFSSELRAWLTRFAPISPAELTIASGAGVSIEHPSHCPSGADLMRQAFGGYFRSRTLAEISGAYTALRRATGRTREDFVGRPRLEAVLDVVRRCYGDDALGHLATNFSKRRPNRVHRLLASHLAAGGHQITANFDRFIEACVAPGAVTGPLHHFHGEIRDGESRMPDGAILGEIEHGFGPVPREAFLAPLVRPECRIIAWIGYSFSDYFDATPALMDAVAAGRLDGKVLVWFDFDRRTAAFERLTSPDGLPRVLAAAVTHGLEVVRLRGTSGDQLAELLEVLGCQIRPGWRHALPCDCAVVPRASQFEATREQRRDATFELLARFGLIGRVGRGDGHLADLDHRSVPSHLQQVYWWKKGRYARGLRAELSLLRDRSEATRIRRLLARSRCAWIEGRLLRAGCLVLRAISRLGRMDDPPPVLMCEALERYGRIAVHMARYRDTRVLALRWFRARLKSYPAMVANFASRAADVDAVAYRHLTDAYANFRREVEGKSDPAVSPQEERRHLVEFFDQTEAIDAVVDYVRGIANDGDFRMLRVPRRATWHRPMGRLYEAVGNDADLWRMHLLVSADDPDATLGRALSSAFHLKMSNWNRLRFLVRFVLNARAGVNAMRR